MHYNGDEGRLLLCPAGRWKPEVAWRSPL